MLKQINLKFGILAILFLIVGLIGTMIITPKLSAEGTNSTSDAACESLGSIDGNNTCQENENGITVQKGLRIAIGFLSYVAGIIGLVMIMIGGVRYATSTGDPKKVSQAKNTILFAIVGLVVAASAQLIVHFAIKLPNGTNSNDNSQPVRKINNNQSTPI